MPLPKPPAQRASRLDATAYSVDLTPSKPRAVPPSVAPAKSPGPAPATPPVAAATAEVLRLPTPAHAPAPAAKSGLPTKSASKAPARAAAPKRTRKPAEAPKLFVLDTNVLMHDPMSLFRFEEHDVFLPMITLEELDGHKKGMTEVARNVRQVSRELDQLAASLKSSSIEEMGKGLPLAGTGHREAEGKLFFQTQLIDTPLPQGLPQGKADNQILGVVQALKGLHPGREVVLVSKDINMRIKARALGLPAEDYR
ncbi:MAG: PhoH family protein, partial [Burkholderiales bacterium]